MFYKKKENENVEKLLREAVDSLRLGSELSQQKNEVFSENMRTFIFLLAVALQKNMVYMIQENLKENRNHDMTSDLTYTLATIEDLLLKLYPERLSGEGKS